jgi:hypothetical protein
MMEVGQVRLKFSFLATLLPISLFANRTFVDSAHYLCHHIMFGMCCSLLSSCYCQEAGWAPRVCFDFCYGELPLSTSLIIWQLPLPKSRGIRVNLILSAYPVSHPAKKNNPFKVMQLVLIAMQLRIFELLPTMQNPSSFIEVQKVCHYNSTSTHIS